MLGLLRTWRRRRLLKGPFPTEWVNILEESVPFYAHLDEGQQHTLRDQLLIFATEKYWIGAAGLEVTDEMKVAISASAVRLTLSLGIDVYNRLTEIVIYPHAYRHPDGDGIILGEARSWGTVVLSWPAVKHGLYNPCDGHDTAVHEFAHVLDRASGRFNGTPRLHANEDYRVWGEVMSARFENLRQNRSPERSVLRSYGATNEAEFFAVATESFFERPIRMKKETPDLYEELERFYGFDPASQPICGRPER